MELTRGLLPKTAIISFNAEYESQLEISNQIPHIYFAAEDLNENDLLNPNDYKQDQFKKAAEFIKYYVDKDYDLIFQCKAGVSRSAGCAAATDEYFNKEGLKYFTDYCYRPNKVFYNNLLRELED